MNYSDPHANKSGKSDFEQLFLATSLSGGFLLFLVVHNMKVRISGHIWFIFEAGLLAAKFVLIFLAHWPNIPILWAAKLSLLSWLSHIFSFVISTILYRLSPFHPLYTFPGPILCKITSLKFAYIIATGKRHSIVAKLHEKYGKIIRTGPNTLSVNLHEAIGPVYASSLAWNKSPSYDASYAGGEGIFTILDRQKHNERRRDYWVPAFTSKAVSSYISTVLQKSEQLVEAIIAQQTTIGQVNFSEVFEHWTYDITGILSFGDAYKTNVLANGDSKQIIKRGAIGTMVWETLGEIPSLFDILWCLPTVNSVKNLGKAAQGVKTNPIARMQRNYAHYLFGEHDSSLPKLSDGDLRVEIAFLIQAGTNALATVANFALFYLLKEPYVYAKLKAELDSQFAEDKHCLFQPDTSSTLALLSSLPYLNAVVDETLRLGAPFGQFPRVSPKGGAIFECSAQATTHYIPEGTIVAVPWVQAVSGENFYPYPLEFKPERWLPGGLGPGSRTNRQAIPAFGWGPFGCLGKVQALHQLRILIATLLLTFDCEFAPGFDEHVFLDNVCSIRAVIFKYPLSVSARARS